MLDTIKIAIPLDLQQFSAINAVLSNRDEYQLAKYNPVRDDLFIPFQKGTVESISRFLNKKVDYSIPSKYLKNETFFVCEFSITKFAFCHNIILLYDWFNALNRFRELLNATFSVDLPTISDWLIKRLDICYAYSFPTQELAQSYINSLKNLSFPYKKATIYETSINFPGTTYSFKIYLKKPEFFHKDRKDLIKNELPLEAIRELELLSEGVLRIETTLRQKWLHRNGINTIGDLLKHHTRIILKYETPIGSSEKEELLSQISALVISMNQKGINIEQNIKTGRKTPIKNGEIINLPETTVVHNGIIHHFPKGSAYFETTDRVTSILKDVLNTFLGENRTMDNKYDVLETLKSHYTNKKALDLFSFWLFLQQMGMKEARKEYTKPTYYRNVAELKKAGISLIEVKEEDVTHEFLKKFKLEVPSEFVVNRPGEYPKGQIIYFPESVNQ